MNQKNTQNTKILKDNKKMDKKELNKAIEKTVLKMALEPKNTDHYHELAKYYAMDNQYEKVISVYESLLEIDPKDLQTLLNLGSIWEMLLLKDIHILSVCFLNM